LGAATIILRPDDPRLTWAGAISLQRTDEWVMPWRIPYAERALFPPDALRERASMPAGVRIAFRSDTTWLRGAVVPFPEASNLDLCCDGQLIGSASLDNQDRFAFDGLPAGDKLVELWLPQFGDFRLASLEIAAGASIAPAVDNRPRWITYGSSITQCRTAASPTRTWPAIVARARNYNLTCLGYGGQCHLDPMIARMIRDLPADYLSICAGINIYGAASLGPRAFVPALIGFVQILRERHPATPLAILSPIYSPPRETTPNAVGFTLQAMRDAVAEAVALLQSRGDQYVHYVDGLRVFGTDLGHLLPDDLHPSAEGYQIMGQNFLKEVADVVFMGR